MANIAIIGWGSLIWDPRKLGMSSKWYGSGPRLPVEFARKSDNGRVTLVLVPGLDHMTRTYWCVSSFDDVHSAAENLKEREGTPLLDRIHVADHLGPRTAGLGAPIDATIGRKVGAWLEGRPEIDAVAWTGLEPKYFDTTTEADLCDQVVSYLQDLTEPTRQTAKQYIENAPASVDTPVRRAIESKLGWRRTRLDSSLFEDRESGDPCHD